MDLEVFVATHRGEWDRLAALLDRGRRLAPAETDELVELYRRVSTHLSMLRSASPDPVLLTRLSTLVARARAGVTGTSTPTWREVSRFLTVGFPAVVYRARYWALAVGVGFLLLSASVATWVARSPSVQASIATPAQIRELVDTEFERYYSAHPAAAFAAQVWTNNAWVAAAALAFGVALGVPVLYLLWQNALNVGVAAGLMAANGKLPIFFGLVLPHGMLELSAVFVASGLGLRLGWTVIDPGRRPRALALASEGRATLSAALGLAGVLAVSGAIEAFVTPSPLPTFARVAVGVAAVSAFVGYVGWFGSRAVRAGETGDLPAEDREQPAPMR